MLLSNLDVLATAPGGVARLRELILTLAVQGKLVPQDPADEPASELLKKIRAEKDRLIAEGKIKRDKPLAGISEGEWPFEVPKGWEWVRCTDYFVELCTGPFGSVIHQQDYVFDGVPLINPSHMVGGRIVHDPRVTLKREDAERLSAYALSAGDLVLARRGEVGRYALVTEREHGWLCGTGSFFVRLHKACNREYLGLLFTDVRFRQDLQGQSVGTTMTNLNQRILLDALIALPPLAEQSRIVTRVEELMRLCDALEAKGRLEAAQHAQLVTTLLATLTDSATPEALADHWQRLATHFDTLLDRPSSVDALEQTILQLAVRGLLVPQNPADEPASVLLKHIRTEKDRLIAAGQIKRDKPLEPITDDEKPFELPAGWAWARFGQIAEIASNLVSPAAHSAMWQVAPDCIEKGTGRLLFKRTVAEAGVGSPNHRFSPGQILYSKIRPSLSKAVLVDFEGLCSADMYPINSRLNINFLLMFMLSQSFLAQVSVAENRVKMPKLNQEALVSFLLPLPPLAEQARIVARVESLRRLCADLRQRLAASQTAQAQLAGALVGSVSH
jgi:type I restriction enzyme S subunit